MTKDEIKAAAEQCISMPDNSLQRIFDRLSTRLNDVLCEMKPDYDDSMVGFNEAWDVMRAVFKDELAKAALTGDVAQRPRKQPSTPLPWKFSPWHIEEGPPVVRAPSGYIVCTTASDQDAEYIAEACNAYAAQPPAAPVETPPCVHKTCDDPEWCAGEPKCRYAHSSAETEQDAGPCINCGRRLGEHSFDTRDICNFYLGGPDDIPRTVPDRKSDAGGAGQGGVVSGDAAGKEDLRGATASSLRGDREVTIGHLHAQPQRGQVTADQAAEGPVHQ